MDEDFAERAEELSSRTIDGGSRGRGVRGRGGKGRGGRGGGRGGKTEGGGMNREVAISKALSKLLRHAAEDVGLKLDPEGYAHLDEVVSNLILFFDFTHSAIAKELAPLLESRVHQKHLLTRS
jgi:hypothetical protein